MISVFFFVFLPNDYRQLFLYVVVEIVDEKYVFFFLDIYVKKNIPNYKQKK